MSSAFGTGGSSVKCLSTEAREADELFTSPDRRRRHAGVPHRRTHPWRRSARPDLNSNPRSILGKTRRWLACNPRRLRSSLLSCVSRRARQERREDNVANLRVAVDIGGTFTDICILDQDTGQIRIAKTSSTKDPIDGVMSGLRSADVDLNQVVLFLARHHGRHQRAHHPAPAAHRHDLHRGLPRRAGDPASQQGRHLGYIQGRRAAVRAAPRSSDRRRTRRRRRPCG